MSSLRAELVEYVPSHDGKQADMYLVEPNGDRHRVRCLVKPSGTDIGGDGDALEYLNSRYGAATVVHTARGLVLGEL